MQPQWARTAQRRQGHALQRRLLEHKLLTAVSPWVGEVDLLCARPRPAMRPRRGTARGAGGRGRGPGTCPGATRGRRGRGRGTYRHTCLPGREGQGPCTQCQPAGVASASSSVSLSTWQLALEGARGSPWHSQCAGAHGRGIRSRGRESRAQEHPSLAAASLSSGPSAPFWLSAAAAGVLSPGGSIHVSVSLQLMVSGDSSRAPTWPAPQCLPSSFR